MQIESEQKINNSSDMLLSAKEIVVKEVYDTQNEYAQHNNIVKIDDI